jgi:hypothetical protein
MISKGNTNFIGSGGANLKLLNFDIYGTQTGDINFATAPGVMVDGNGNIVSGTPSTMSGDTVSSANQNTGANSLNNADASSANSTTLNNFNNGLINNNVNINAGTGGNSTANINGDSTITTGDANIAASLINFLNSSITAAKNFVVGVVNIFGTFNGDIILPGYNDGSSVAATADPSLSASAANANTGSNSNNSADAGSSNSTQINNINNAGILNNLNVTGDTGNNGLASANGNTAITTGAVTEQGNVVNVGNQSSTGTSKPNFWLVIVNKLGHWTGQILGTDSQGHTIASSNTFEFSSGDLNALNNNTGNGSSNTANAGNSNQTTVNNVNNGQIANNVTINASTGGNSFKSNNGNNTLRTGNVSVLANIVNFINHNFVGQNFGIAIINVFGKWTGNVITPDYVAPKVTSAPASASTADSSNNQSQAAPAQTLQPMPRQAADAQQQGTAGTNTNQNQEVTTGISMAQSSVVPATNPVSAEQPITNGNTDSSLSLEQLHFDAPVVLSGSQSNIKDQTSTSHVTVFGANNSQSSNNAESLLAKVMQFFNTMKIGSPFGIGGSLLVAGVIGGLTKKKFF